MNKNKMSEYDAVIIGGGMVGLTIACALGQQSFNVAVVEANEPQDINTDGEYELRVSAISKSSQQVLKNIKAWPGIISRRACAYQHMHVWDAMGEGKIHFDAAELGIDSLGHIIENRVIQYALFEQCKTLPSVDCLCPQQVVEIIYAEEESSIGLDNGMLLKTSLLIGADGANSRVREAANIEIDASPYQQKAVVAVIKNTRHHQDTAWQRFLPSGPLAFLPLGNGSCSIVWSAENQTADQLLAMNEKQFARALEDAFDLTLGKVELVSERAAFPLVRRHAKQYIKKGLALVGDAAHTIHPLAGQGVNLGLLDAAALTEVLIEARAGGKTFSAISTLRKYERWRRADNSMMMYSMSGFKSLFSNEQAALSMLRNAGLNLVDNSGIIKHKFMRHALGLEGDLPSMAKSVGW